MQNNLMKIEDEFQEENEINIYDLINIFIKNIKLFVIVSILGVIVTCLYIGKRIVFGRNNVLSISYTLNYAELESYLGEKVYYPKKSPNEILLEDKYLEKFFENEELKEYYEKNIKENRDNINTKRQFLTDNKILENIPKRENSEIKDSPIIPNSYRITVKINKGYDKDGNASYKILEAYLNILKDYYNKNIFEFINNREKYLEGAIPILKKELIDNTIVGEVVITDMMNNENNYLKYFFPIKVSNIDSYYPEYVKLESEYQAIKTLFGLGLNKIENFIKYDSSIIVEKEKSGNIIKLGIGIFLSLCLGVLATFIKEFVEGYKKNKKDL
ncbi:hypothetical protein LDJ96_08740 [Fusobacterium nucleatum]|uniref:hypothetical protein n=1 Tax=Fusobacterium nucleatum TaxID=851 RepID=UPI0030CAF16A